MQSSPRNNSNFKRVCLYAVNAFELIDSLKNLLNEFKSAIDDKSPKNDYVKLNQGQIDETRRLLANFKTIFKFINRKKSIKLVRKKIGNKRRSRKINQDESYAKALLEFAKSHMAFQGQTLNNINPCVEPKEVERKNRDFEKINNNINEIKELSEYGNILVKLIEIRSKNRTTNHSNTHIESIKRLKDFIELLETRKKNYQAEKTTLKELNKNLDSSLYDDDRNKASKNLSILEAKINKNLFGSSSNSDFTELNCFELFYKQSDVSLNNLIVIRQEWDDFLSCSSNAQSIPIQWVSLEEPKDIEWSQFIKIKT